MEEEKPIEISDEDLPPDNDDSNENTYINAVAKLFDPFTQKQKEIESFELDFPFLPHTTGNEFNL